MSLPVLYSTACRVFDCWSRSSLLAVYLQFTFHSHAGPAWARVTLRGHMTPINKSGGDCRTAFTAFKYDISCLPPSQISASLCRNRGTSLRARILPQRIKVHAFDSSIIVEEPLMDASARLREEQSRLHQVYFQLH